MRHESASKPLAVLIVSLLIIGVTGYTAYFYYLQNQQQSEIILGQSDQIVQKSMRISQLEGEVRNKSALIVEKNDQLQDLFENLDVLGVELEFAQDEISKLTPKIRNYYVVGVDSEGNGVVVPLEVKVTKGTGAVSVNINNVDLLPGAQGSVRTAAKVAADYADVTLSENDVTVSFVYNEDSIVTVDGGSAGSAITATIIAAMTQQDITSEVLMTGTIDSSGNVGPIGSQAAKAEAARDFGASTFLVPSGQYVDVAGITVVEVGDIDDVVERVINVN